MEVLFADFDFWHWLVLGLALIISWIMKMTLK